MAHVKNSKLKTLSPARQVEMAVRLKKDSQDSVAFNSLCTQYDPLIKLWVRKCRGNFPGHDDDDMRMIITNLVYIACKSFDPTKGIQFHTYLTHIIIKNIKSFNDELRAQKRKIAYEPMTSLNEYAFTDTGDNAKETVEETIPDKTSTYEFDLLIFQNSLSMLNETEQLVCQMLFVDKYTCIDVAKHLKVSSARVTHIKNQIRTKLKDCKNLLVD